MKYRVLPRDLHKESRMCKTDTGKERCISVYTEEQVNNLIKKLVKDLSLNLSSVYMIYEEYLTELKEDNSEQIYYRD